jgi:hypothetical protein
MGYHYLRAIHNKFQIQLLKSLQVILANSNCLGLGAWSEMMVESGQFQSISDSDDENSLYLSDKNDQLSCITFPAILNLDGKYSRISSYFSFSDEENVSFFFLYLIFISLIRIYKNINLSTFQQIKAICQLFPLMDLYMNDVPAEIAEWSSQTINVIDRIYAKTEEKIQRCQFFITIHISLISFFLLFFFL